MKTMRIQNLRISSFLFIILFILLFVGDLFVIPALQYLDEILEIVALLWLLYSFINKRNVETVLMLASIFLVGIIGNSLSGYAISLKNIILDYFLILKFPIIFISLFDFCKYKNHQIDEVLGPITFVSIFMSLFLFLDCLVLFFKSGGERVSFLNTSYAGTGGLYAFAFSLVLAKNLKINKGFKISIILLNFITAAFFSKSSAATIYFLALFMAYFYSKYISKKVKGYYMIVFGSALGLVLVLTIFQSKIQGYFINDKTAPRYLFFTNSFYLANKYKGFGVGFGLFGGNVAANNYSPVYIDLGFNNIWTVAKDSNFLMDSFFPVIIGELGYIGLCLYLLLIFNCIKKIGINKKLIFIFIVIFLGVFASNFINSAVGVCFVFGILIYYLLDPTKTNKKL